MSLWIIVAAVILAAGGVMVGWQATAPSPLEGRRKGPLAKAAERIEAGRLGKYVEDRVGGASEATGLRYALILMGSGLVSLAVLVPIFGYAAPLAAIGVAWLVGWIYLQAGTRKRKRLLQQQTLRLGGILAAKLKRKTGGGTLRDQILRSLERMGPPLEDDLGTALKAVRQGADYAATMDELQRTTHSPRLRRFVELLQLIDSSDMETEQQRQIFDHFHSKELAKEARAGAVEIIITQSRSTLLIITLLVPLMLVVKFLLRGPVMVAYMSSPLGQLILGTAFVMLFIMVFVGLRWMRVTESE